MIWAPAALIQMGKACKGFLAAEDPYQYESLTTEQLVNVRIRHVIDKYDSPALMNEIKKRLAEEELTRDEREILTKALEWR